MIIKKIVGIFDDLKDFNDYMDMYKNTEWTLLAEHTYIQPFKEEYICTYIAIHIKEVEGIKE